MQKLLLIFYHPENRATSQIWKILPNMVFPPIWGEKMAAFWACACKLSWTLLSPARVQPLYGAGRKESSGTGLRSSQIANHARALDGAIMAQFFLDCVIIKITRGLARAQNWEESSESVVQNILVKTSEAARAISAFWKTHSCKLIPNWTRNRMITYTKKIDLDKMHSLL